MRSIAGLWRWRGNRLFRRTDRAEGWLALGAALLIAVAAPAVGLWSGRAAHDTLMDTVRQQHRERQPVWATVAEVLTPPTAESEPDSASDGTGGHRAVATWTGPDSGTRTGVVAIDHPLEPGERLRVWVGPDGRLVPRPMDATTASSHAMLAGLGAAAAWAALVEAGRQLVLRRLMRRRYARWDEEWARVGPDWGRTGPSN